MSDGGQNRPGASRRLAIGAAVAVCCAGCGSSVSGAPGAGAEAGADGRVEAGTTESGVEAGPSDSGQPPNALATGTRIVSREATFEGLTSDGYVVFSEPIADGGRVAEVVALDGGGQATIATGTSTDKTLRIVTSGKVAFVWTDRGNRIATLTVWSKATGAVPIGMGIRPGRAAASADGTSIAYMNDVTTTTANVVVGPISASGATVVGVANASDPNCWRDVDMAFVGTAAQRFLSYYCPQSTTSFAVQSTAADGSGSAMLSTSAVAETFGSDIVVVLDGTGALSTSAPDGTSLVAIASNAATAQLSRDQTSLYFGTTNGGIGSSPVDASVPTQVVPAGGAVQLGFVSANDQLVMFAGAASTPDGGSAPPTTDVRVASSAPEAGAPSVLIASTTSCVNCLTDPFSPDSTQALAIDPVDTTTALAGSGPLRAFSLADGSAGVTFGTNVWDAIALSGGSGTGSRFLLVEIAQAPQLETGFSYDLYTRTLVANDMPTYVARAVENAGIDSARSFLVYSIPGSGNLAGVWVAPLQ